MLYVHYPSRAVCATVTVLVAIAFASSNWVSATPITGISTLQDLIDRGSTGVTLHGLRFYSFAYTGTTIGGIVPSASQIGVSDASDLFPDTSCGPFVGIRFSSGWSAIGGEIVDSLISYRVATVDPTKGIGCVDLQFNGSAFPVGEKTFTSVQETVQRSDGRFVVDSDTMGILSVYNDGTGGLPDINSQYLSIAPSTDLIVTKDINLRAGSIPRSADFGGVATISWVDNGFSIPEPTSGLLILVTAVPCLLSLGRSRRRR